MTTISITVDELAQARIRRRLDPRKVGKALNRALNKGSRHIERVVKAESRVGKSRRYKDDWFTRKESKSHSIINENTGDYAQYVTGNTMATTLAGGRRAGAGEAFLLKVQREQRVALREIMKEAIREEYVR